MATSVLDLSRDVLAHLSARFLEVPDIVALSSACKRLRAAINDNSVLFCMLCVRLLGHSAPETRNQLTTSLGLAGNGVSWREFFQWTYGSTVLTWGTGENRTGHLRPKVEQPPAPQDDAEAGDRQQMYYGYGEAEFLVKEPTVLEALSRQAISFVGKTAEVGSIAVSMGGSRVYVWGNYAGTIEPRLILARDIAPGDRVIEASCGHDTGFILVFASGRTFVGKARYRGYRNEPMQDRDARLGPKDFFEFTEHIFGCVLNPGERPCQSLGSQSSIGGVLTSEGRVLCWTPWSAESYCERVRLPLPAPEPVVTPPDDADDLDRLLWTAESEVELTRRERDIPTRPVKPFDEVLVVDPVADGVPISIAKCAFGHRMWFAIGTDGALYEISLPELSPRMYNIRGAQALGAPADDDNEENTEKTPVQWRRVRGTETISDPIVSVDCGSAHQAFCTTAGDAYTWGASSFGMLGHGDASGGQQETPKLVEFFREIGKRVVAVGAGGYIHWNGAFTLFLCHDNSLYVAGMLGSREEHLLPTRIDCESLRGRHILSISCGEDWAAIVASAVGKTKTEQ